MTCTKNKKHTSWFHSEYKSQKLIVTALRGAVIVFTSLRNSVKKEALNNENRMVSLSNKPRTYTGIHDTININQTCSRVIFILCSTRRRRSDRMPSNPPLIAHTRESPELLFVHFRVDYYGLGAAVKGQGRGKL